ncbi:hypothetical protein B0H10DRAFT_1986051 [Mycena sp. CBHHK59/15]|nr:hypothetical protein B0H10DRAFT_1986051 [Mycena sp. CBHHK59/15]
MQVILGILIRLCGNITDGRALHSSRAPRSWQLPEACAAVTPAANYPSVVHEPADCFVPRPLGARARYWMRVGTGRLIHGVVGERRAKLGYGAYRPGPVREPWALCKTRDVGDPDWRPRAIVKEMSTCARELEFSVWAPRSARSVLAPLRLEHIARAPQDLDAALLLEHAHERLLDRPALTRILVRGSGGNASSSVCRPSALDARRSAAMRLRGCAVGKAPRPHPCADDLDYADVPSAPVAPRALFVLALPPLGAGGHLTPPFRWGHGSNGAAHHLAA